MCEKYVEKIKDLIETAECDYFNDAHINGLLCSKCWGRTLRTVETPKYLKRLLKAWRGFYVNGNDKAIKRLVARLDKVRDAEIKKARQDVINDVAYILEGMFGTAVENKYCERTLLDFNRDFKKKVKSKNE